ncbi:MAG: CotH kinase family protein [Verrucomicrobiales bacterium]|nr:CotH kinase family protein [Verrucomicrobiales bacterium]
MNANRILRSFALLALAVRAGNAADAELELKPTAAWTEIRVFGSAKADWWLESSLDLKSWSVLPGAAPLLADPDDPPARELPAAEVPGPVFYRTRRTGGLYDLGILRTVSLTFTQANWPTLLANGRNTGSNTPALLVMDNGARIDGVGARYKGNTSYSGGPGGGTPTKKSINLELDFTDPDARLLGYRTLNLNNAYGDETILREPVYFSLMQQYAVSPKGSLVRLYINDAYWGVYSFAEQENNDLLDEWFPSHDGDRWSAPNMPGDTGGGGGGGGRPPGGGGGGFGSGVSALSYLGADVASYTGNYELKSDHSTNAWERLIHACQVLNQTSAATFRDEVENVLAVDRWLWFLALENLFADDDSYWNKGADYGFYYEPESGRIHPVEHDGNEAFMTADATLSPVQGATDANRPVLQKLLGVPELRQRYLAHLRTVLEETFHPDVMTPLIDELSALSYDAVVADTKKGYTMAGYASDLLTLKRFVTNRYNYLTTHAELRAAPPVITAVNRPSPAPVAGATGWITAAVASGDTSGVGSVWLYHRGHAYGRFAVTEMFDDGAHGDGVAGDGVFGGETGGYTAGTKVRFYIEARAANTSLAAAFSPARAEEDTYNYRVGLATAPATDVVINEFMASNVAALADPQGEFDDWIELRNLTDAPVDLTGRYLTDNPDNPRKWSFPDGTTIPADGYLLVWADEDGKADGGLHANFKLSADGEEIYLIDTDGNLNAVLDHILFGSQQADLSFGRTAADPDVWVVQIPTPGGPNP